MDAVGVWGQRGVARRGFAAARRFRRPVVVVEDAFLRSVQPGREEPPAGLLIDETGVYYDANAPSAIEDLLASDLTEEALARARAGLALFRRLGLSKYNAWDLAAPLPEPGFVLVVDQTRDDASIAGAGATAATFDAMLAAARAENPGARILLRPHPEVVAGRKRGHLRGGGDVGVLPPNLPPAAVLARAARVYTVSSQLGFEAILAGHRPRVFGLPFYAGWGLSDDEMTSPRRGKVRSAEAVFSAAMLEAPTWYDLYDRGPATFEDAATGLAVRAAAHRLAPRGAVCHGMRLWKRPAVASFLRGGPVRFEDDAARAVSRAAAGKQPLFVWAGRETADLAARCAAAEVPLFRVEDGFLRSAGLGAALVPALSLVFDDLGIYYDPGRPSRLEALIAEAVELPEDALDRARRLREGIVSAGLSKYNVGEAAAIEVPAGRQVILVPGQVEDDASIRLGASDVRTNLGLLEATRAANPEVFLIYKPHPDVEAGLRQGRVPEAALTSLADHVARRADPASLLARADAVWTMTSLMGFEALLRGVPVHTLGQPFYAGWGLTQDHGPPVARRTARPGLDALVHAALIDYPTYRDPVSRLPAPPEVIVRRLSAPSGRVPRQDPALRLLAKAQGLFASYAHWWR
ncbi:MAG: capsular polysaccharide biosynthesis protein [Pseudomonadota bacterium]